MSSDTHIPNDYALKLVNTIPFAANTSCLEERKVLYAPSPFNFCLVKKLATRHKTSRPWGRGGVELWRRAAGVGTWRSLPQEVWRCAEGVLPLCFKSSGGALEACRRGGMEFGSSGDALQACRRRGIEVWSSGAREARCGRVGVEEWSSGGAL